MKIVALFIVCCMILTPQLVHAQKELPNGAIKNTGNRKIGITYEQVQGDDGRVQHVPINDPEPDSELENTIARSKLLLAMQMPNSNLYKIFNNFSGSPDLFEKSELEVTDRQIEELKELKASFDKESEGMGDSQLLDLRIKYGQMINEILFPVQIRSVKSLSSNPFVLVLNPEIIDKLEISPTQIRRIKSQRDEINRKAEEAIESYEKSLEQLRRAASSAFEKSLDEKQKEKMSVIVNEKVDKWFEKFDLQYLFMATQSRK